MSQELKDEIKRLFDVTPEDVNSVSYGFKFQNGEKTGKLSIIFGVNQKKPLTDLKAEEILPQEIVVNGVTYVTDVVENEIPRLQQCYPDSNDPNIQRLRGNPSLLKPMRGGQEIIQFPTGWTPSGGGGYNISVGTLGFFAVDNTDNKIVGVTNSHVVCDERVYCDEQDINVANASPYNTCQERPWTNVDPNNDYFPGALVNDNGSVELAGYNIKRYQPVSNTGTNYVDGALLIINNTSPAYVDGNSYMVWQPIGTPDYAPYLPFASTAEIDNLLVTNPSVYSTGRTTGPKGYTAAADCALVITELHVNAYVNDNGTLQYWGDCIKYAYQDGSNYPSAGGDSGSAVLADISGTRKVIGLLFAGSTTYTLCNRIDRVAQTMNIRAWDASYSLNLTQPSPQYKVCNLSLGYGGVASVVLDGETWYQAGFTLTTALPTMPPVPSMSPSPTPSPSPTLSPTFTPSPSPSPSPSPTPSPTPFVQNELWGFGLNTGGQLALGNAITRSSPAFMGIYDYKSIPQGNSSLYGIAQNNSMFVWAIGTSGQLGIDAVTNRTSRVLVGGAATWAFATGGNSAFAVKTDGTLWTTGTNTSGSLAQNDTVNRSSWTQVGTDTDWAPSGDTNPTLNYGIFVLKTNGTIWAAGDNGSGQLGDGTSIDRSSMVQMGSENYWAEVQSSGLYTYALDNTGRLWVVGYNANGRQGTGNIITTSSFVQVAGGHTWLKFAAGSSACYAIRNDNTLWSWGVGSNGALGLDSTTNVTTPVQIGSFNNWADVGAGIGFGAAINTLGELWVWGANTYGNLGVNSVIEYSSPVQTLIADTNWKNVFVGSNTLFAWRVNQSTTTPSPTPSATPTSTPTPTPSATPSTQLYGWGQNTTGQLARGVSVNTSTPAFISGNVYTDMPSGGNSKGALSYGEVYGWGNNSQGQTGDNSTLNRNVATRVGLDNNWTSLSINGSSAGIRNGQLYVWGNGLTGAMANNILANISSPVLVNSSTDWAKVFTSPYTGTAQLFAIKNDTTMWGCGNNNFGGIGAGNTIDYSSLVQISGTGWDSITLANGSSFAIKTDGSLWVTGYNNFGQLGINSTASRNTWTQVGTESNWVQISCNSNTTVARKSDNTAWVWGNDTSGGLGLNTNAIHKSSPTQLGSAGWTYVTACATGGAGVKTDGTLWCWGIGTTGQMGNNTIITSSSPIQTSIADNGWIRVVAGQAHFIAERYVIPPTTPTPTPT